MTVWNLQELRNAVERRYGRAHRDTFNQSLNSVVQRKEFAKYHYSEAKRLLAAATADHSAPGELMMLLFGGTDESIAFNQARFQAAAHITSCVQDIHAIADILAHTVYFALGMNLDASTALKPRQIGMTEVIKKMPSALIRQLLTDLTNHDGFRYISALNNHSKHRSIVDTPYTIDLTSVPEPSGLQFAAFTYDNQHHAERWAMPTLDEEFGRQSALIIGIGQTLNSTLLT